MQTIIIRIILNKERNKVRKKNLNNTCKGVLKTSNFTKMNSFSQYLRISFRFLSIPDNYQKVPELFSTEFFQQAIFFGGGRGGGGGLVLSF